MMEADLKIVLQQGNGFFKKRDFPSAIRKYSDVIEGLEPLIKQFGSQVKGKLKDNSNMEGKKNVTSAESTSQSERQKQSKGLSKTTVESSAMDMNITCEIEMTLNSMPEGPSHHFQRVLASALSLLPSSAVKEVVQIPRGRTSVFSLQALAQWSLINLFNTYWHNLNSLQVPLLHVRYHPILLSCIDKEVERFQGRKLTDVYPYTSQLSSVLWMFSCELELKKQNSKVLNHSQSLTNNNQSNTAHLKPRVQVMSKQSSNSSKALNSQTATTSSEKPGEWQDTEMILTYAKAIANRAQCFLNQSSFDKCVRDCNLFLEIPDVEDIPVELKAKVNFRKGRALFRGALLKKDKFNCAFEEKGPTYFQSERGRAAYIEYLKDFKNAAISFAHALFGLNLSEFQGNLHECNVEMFISQYEVLQAKVGECKLGTCCLCWKNAKLLQSHIFPKFILNHLSDSGRLLFGSQLRGPSQATWCMLCEECELLFCKTGEDPFSKDTFQPFLQQPAEPLQVKYGLSMFYFFASLMWRVMYCIQYEKSGLEIKEALNVFRYFDIRKYLMSKNPVYLHQSCMLVPIYRQT